MSHAAAEISWSGIDRLSLQIRAVRGLRQLDPRLAREAFEQIRLPLEERFTCEKPYYFKYGAYYTELLPLWDSIANTADRVNFLTGRLAQFRSAAQTPLLAEMLAGAIEKRRDEVEPLVYTFGARLAALDHDGRLVVATLRPTMAAVKRLALASGGGGREFLVQQTREWVLQASRKGVCSDRALLIKSLDGKTSRQEPMLAIDLFNSELAPLAKNQAMIDPKDAGGVLPGPAYDKGGYSPDYLRFDQMRRLLERDAGEEKITARWASEVENYVTAVTEWNNPATGDADPTPFYLEKADLLHRILALKHDAAAENAPPSDRAYWESRRTAPQAAFQGRDRTMTALLNLYEGGVAASVYNRRRCFWFAPIHRLLMSPENTPALDDFMLRSKDPVLHLYAALARIEAAAGVPRR